MARARGANGSAILISVATVCLAGSGIEASEPPGGRGATGHADAAIIARILSMNPAIYEDIQFGNPYVPEMLEKLSTHLAELTSLVKGGDDNARTAFRQEFLQASHDALGAKALDHGNYSFENLGYLLADMTEVRTLSVHLPVVRPGSLRALLHVFERHGVSLSSVHSSRTPEGEVHFRMGFTAESDSKALVGAIDEIAESGIGRVLPRPEASPYRSNDAVAKAGDSE